MTVTKQAYAKINLYLDVMGKRPDGYHDIKSVMLQVSLHDTVTVTRDGGDGIRLADMGDDRFMPSYSSDSRFSGFICAGVVSTP